MYVTGEKASKRSRESMESARSETRRKERHAHGPGVKGRSKENKTESMQEW